VGEKEITVGKGVPLSEKVRLGVAEREAAALRVGAAEAVPTGVEVGCPGEAVGVGVAVLNSTVGVAWPGVGLAPALLLALGEAVGEVLAAGDWLLQLSCQWRSQ
jgi:hypothetical protein